MLELVQKDCRIAGKQKLYLAGSARKNEDNEREQ
jgi:hypothetical protein